MQDSQVDQPMADETFLLKNKIIYLSSNNLKIQSIRTLHSMCRKEANC